jgi:hypothetical protein
MTNYELLFFQTVSRIFTFAFCLFTFTLFFLAAFNEGQIIGAAARQRIGCAAARSRGVAPAVNASGGQAFAVNGFD